MQYAIPVAMNHIKNKKDQKGISKIKAFIGQYEWIERYFPPRTGRMFEKKKEIALFLFFCWKKKKTSLHFKAQFKAAK